MDLGLKGKAALVTGASRGLGYATALILAREGARVAINSRDPLHLEHSRQQIVQQTGAEVIAVAGDVSQADVPAQVVSQTLAVFGGLDILITNTGGPTPGRFDAVDDAEWQRAIDLILMSHVRLIRAALPALRQSVAASVLTITSISAKQPIANLVLSNSIRGATVVMTKSLALEMGREGIRFNSILPAWSDTDRYNELLAIRAEKNGTTVEEEMQKQAKDSPIGRISTPEEFGRAAAFLVSPAASYLTGVMLPVDGGLYKGTF